MPLVCMLGQFTHALIQIMRASGARKPLAEAFCVRVASIIDRWIAERCAPPPGWLPDFAENQVVHPQALDLIKHLSEFRNFSMNSGN